MFIVNYIMNTGVMKKVSDLLSPILKRLKINPLSISSILACFFSPTVGYSILAEGLKENKINEKEVIGTSLANSSHQFFPTRSHFLSPLLFQSWVLLEFCLF
jgi:hypothetical protein